MTISYRLPRKLYARIAFCIAALAALGVESASAQWRQPDWRPTAPDWQGQQPDDWRQRDPDWQDGQPEWRREPEWRGWQRNPEWQGQPEWRQREPEWQDQRDRQRDPQWQGQPDWQRDPDWRDRRDLRQREPEWQGQPGWQREPEGPSQPGWQGNRPREPALYSPEWAPYYKIYGEAANERFAVPAVRLADVDPVFLRRSVYYPTDEAPGTIVIDPQQHFLYFMEGGGRAVRYGVGVGRTGFGWSGTASVHHKQAWPDWFPPQEMIKRQPEIKRVVTELDGGLGMPGGPRNPLGARALYLFQGGKDTLYRIHGTVEPWTIGRNVSSGCIRMINQDVIDLYARAPIGAKVIVLSASESSMAWQQ
jgi:lipoprotein-anchoring transpeptidase ErfK/SrfK